ncbi:hypothetical protein Plo01_50570 [Planobispora longispora]|uniref:Uncharacterized protein n=1 Tax=Planobispora longispora TaxID=28887 RepID=A0A8J3RUU5_9ACTN|nr:hypothetical protein GCM10020093_055160 [Planobispora longispora]GIH78628.1 hypothetical protein Plo01_50570 [Planobispora longispora]
MPPIVASGTDSFPLRTLRPLDAEPSGRSALLPFGPSAPSPAAAQRFMYRFPGVSSLPYSSDSVTNV